MEPIASASAGSILRAGGAASEASALLRDGRLLRAEVLSSTHDGSLLIAIGRHTIPAQTDLRLDPGARFLVQVVETQAGVVLELVAPSDDGEATLLAALRSVVGEERPLGEALGALARALSALPARDGAPGESAPALRLLAETLGGLAPRPGLDGAGLRALLLGLGLGHEAGLAHALGSGGALGGLEALRGDLKARLLRALAALEGKGAEPGLLRDTGPLRATGSLSEAVARALTSVEAEQLLNLARERAGEPSVHSFPVVDGEGWATARLLVPPRRDPRAHSPSDDEAPFRLSFGLEFSNLGPLRADLALAPGLLTVRLLVTRSDVATRIEAALAELRARMGDGKRAVEVSVRLGSSAEAELGLAPLDIRYLREHHLMNVAG